MDGKHLRARSRHRHGRWAYQWAPHDLYDYDGINENLLLDLELDGEERQVLVRPERNGHMYVLDRATGQVLSADTYEHVTVTRGIDLETGRLEVEEKEPREGEVMREICPSAPGAKGLAALGVLAAHRPRLRAAPAPAWT